MADKSINKVVFGGNTLIDLTADTVTPETLAEGVTAHDKSGAPIVGTMQSGGGGGGNADSVIDRSITNITSNAAEVGEYAFYGCEQLVTASFPKATIIRAAAFVGCKSLVSVDAPNVTEIRNDAIDYLHNDMDGNYVKVDIGAFERCSNLTSVNFSSAETIYQKSFRNCTGLTHLKFQSVKIIGETYYNTGGDMGDEM